MLLCSHSVQIHIRYLTFCSFRSLKEAFLNGLAYCDLQLTNDLLVITTLIAENLNSLLVVSTGSVIVRWKSIAADKFDPITALFV